MKIFKQYGIYFAILSLMGMVFYQFNEKNKEINELKKTVLVKDTLIFEQVGLYSKLVNDMRSVKELSSIIDSISSELASLIKERKERPIQTIKQVIEIPSKADTVIVRDTLIKGKPIQFASFYYPRESDYFASVDVSILDGVGVGKFHFMPLELNLAVVEGQDGMYKAYLDGPDFITVGELTVNSLPMKPQFPEKPYKFYLGGGLGYIEGFKFYTSGSMKYKDHMIDLNLFGFSGITLGYKRPL